MEPLVPKGWSYAKLVGDAKPERFDLANPRVYSLAGKQMPWTYTPRQVGASLTATFEHMLADLYRKAPTNSKRAEVSAFLDHHRTKGGNAQALTDHLERMLEHWKENPPQYADLHKLKRVTVEGSGQLTRLVEGWLANAPKAPASATASTLAKSKRPDLKLVALVHALRYLSGDKGADITKENAQGLAEDAGSTAPTSGRELRRHYERYTMGKDHHAQRLDHAKPYTVKPRYLTAIEMLEGYPMAKAMAEAELEELRERE
jgi:hypothetical protein